MHWLNGGEARPTFTPPRPFERGVRKRPTLIDNVETLAHVALIARYGAGWFRESGAAGASGTMLTTVTGAVDQPGVYEVENGSRVGENAAQRYHSDMIARETAVFIRASSIGVVTTRRIFIDCREMNTSQMPNAGEVSAPTFDWSLSFASDSGIPIVGL